MPIDFTSIEGYGKAIQEAPNILLNELARAYRDIGRNVAGAIQATLPDNLNIKAPGLIRSFKAKVTDPGKAKEFRQLFADIYTRWKAAEIFETGGIISGRGKKLTILFPEAKTATGRRRWSQQQIRQMVAAGTMRFVPTPRGVLIVHDVGGKTKIGKFRKNSRSNIIGILKQSVHERKRLNFFATADSQSSLAQDRLETAIENTLVEIATKAE